ncbi:MAG: glutamate formiminotransferase [Thermomicrobiales bacterium]|nr:glutamate formiminotransferase [Thermomicrobiales bacterium]
MPEAEPERSLAAYVAAVAGGASTPGGGSVAAIVGALAAALGEMVANLTLGRARYADAEETLRPARERLVALRERLIGAAAEDERAYAAYRAAAAMPRETVAQKAARTVAMQQALTVATEGPLEVARAAVETAELLEVVARAGNPHVRADAALGALLAEAALRGALLNIRGNAAMLRDAALADGFREAAVELETRGRAAAERAYRAAITAEH